jgi:hypothetical protein
MIGFIDTLFTHFGTTGNYSAITILYTSQFTVAHALGSSLGVSRQRILQQSHCHFKSRMKSSFHSLISSCYFIPIILDCHLQNLTHFLRTTHSNDLLWPFITSRHGPRRKHSLSIVEKVCLLIRCLVMDVLLLRAYTSARLCLPSRCLAMGVCITVLSSL